MMTEIQLKKDELSPGRILLEETFHVLTKKNSVFRVRLTRNGLSLIKETDNQIKETLISTRDIIGCRCLRSKKETSTCSCQSLPRATMNAVEENSGEQDDSDVSAYLYIYAYIMQSNKGVPMKRERTIITLRFRSFDKYEDNNKEAQRWRMVIKELIKGDQVDNIPSGLNHNEQKKLLVLCNPKSGPGRGRAIFQQKIVPILQEAEIAYDLHMTKYANYAREFVRTCNISQWSGIVVVGGDGIIFEAINGMFERPDWSEVIKNVPIGVIPGGSGNGLARSIAHVAGEPYLCNTTLPSALSLVRNNFEPMDIVRVETKSQIVFSFLSVGWGFLSDIDIESERLRMLGGQRFTIWSLARLIGLRNYRGKVWYIPANDTPVHKAKENKKGDNIEIPAEINLETQSARQRLDSWYSAASKRSAYYSITANSSYQSTADSGPQEESGSRMYGPASKLPCLTAEVPSTWKCIDGRFIMVHASYPSHLSEDVLFVPNAKLDDGIIWLNVIKADTSRAQLLQFLLGLSNGTHINPETQDSGSILMLPVRAFRIEPDMSESGYITVDGEHVEYGPIQGELFPGLVRVMVP
ncbi:PREDICTED: sphingosine kinase 2-like [Nicrophorus vespilloides]|uniref:Sphingosine kinase 2-like n=1 Tax=Nicrophorus vespilloides TaxID=110193 RepID=A0ABM1MMZ8_NICVS|nr:PREDICTED: sphingosine kinase 2-like [Nicrophorus vespilloides]